VTTRKQSPPWLTLAVLGTMLALFLLAAWCS
jgi:hypothetical protein